MKSKLKIVSLTIGCILLVLLSWYAYLLMKWPSNSSNEEQEAQWEFEQRCFKDSMGRISNKEKILCDSMLKVGYTKFEIEHKYYYSPCKQVKNYDRFVFRLNYVKDINQKQPETAEINNNAKKLLRRIIDRYLDNQELARFTYYEINGVEGTEGGGISQDSGTLYKSFGFR